eukprot:Protomagalhaensia_wolfi_Nauph_80__742@NODE_1424_length_1538_cov_17_053369_g1101_i0_p1_GENE_NODE_1424_length_1538_cov_17_053369_g1101_i0NODE_1424_length_1538_cov_17_053369_g1101_i0_p1_ORF_typecomplete_len426_score84_19Integrin_beta/PF00362_18/9_9e18VWA/PF00092_28/4_9e06VWA_2/PF13519_6/0_00072_NODE_1424_length_1538_cov_17_053369_g1101_i01021379
MKLLLALTSFVVIPTMADCPAGVALVIVQDTTQSFGPFLDHVTEKIDQVMESIQGEYPGTRFGLVEFKDKPYWPMGYGYDICYHRVVPLTEDPQAIKLGYGSLVSGSGADAPEGHYFAIVNTIFDGQIGWEDRQANIEANKPNRNRIMILATDASPHLAKDYIRLINFPSEGYDQFGLIRPMPAYLPPYPGKPVDTENVTEDCMNYDVPDWQDVRDIILDNDVLMPVFIPNVRNQAYIDWRWVNDDMLSQDPSLLKFVEMDGTGFEEAILEVVDSLCPPATSTEAPPTTPEETVPPTTVPTTVVTETPTVTTTEKPIVTPEPEHPTEGPAVTKVPTKEPTEEPILTTEGFLPTTPQEPATTEKYPTRDPEGGFSEGTFFMSSEGGFTTIPREDCTVECNCYKCEVPRSYIRFGAKMADLSISIRY